MAEANASSWHAQQLELCIASAYLLRTEVEVLACSNSKEATTQRPSFPSASGSCLDLCN